MSNRAFDNDWLIPKRVFDNDRYVYALTSVQLDEDADEETSPTFPLGTGTRRFKTVGAGGFGSIYVGTVRKRLKSVFQGDPEFQLLGYYHNVLLAGHLSKKHTIAMLEEVEMPFEVAVKRVDPRKTDVVELIREASNLRVLWGRRNFVTVYGPTMSRDLGCLCVVTDYVRGCNLNDFLQSRGKDAFKHDRDVEEGARIMCRLWEADEVLWWMQKLILFREIVIALIVCHSQSVYHGDLKGANILLDKTLVPKLVDFGLSFRRNDVFYLRSLGGSLFWAAPEVIDTPGPGAIHESEIVSNPYPSDVYSLGMVLAEMVLDGNIPSSFTDEDFVLADKWSEGCPSYFLDHAPGSASGVDLYRLKKLIDGCCSAGRDDRTTLKQCVSEVNDIISEMFRSSCSSSRCSILYERADHVFTGSTEYQDMVVRFKERFPGVPNWTIYSPSWNMVMDEEENLLVHYFCKLDYAEGVEYIVETSTWGFQPERDIPYMSLICVREESLQTLRYLGASWPDTMKRQLLLLHKACLCNNPEVFRFLLVDVGIDFDTWEANDDMTYKGLGFGILRKPIHKLAARGKTEMVRLILENSEVDSGYVNTTIFRDTVENPVYYAMKGGHVETVSYLLERGAVIFDADEMREKRSEPVPRLSDAELDERERAKIYVDKILSAFETGNSNEVISLHFQIEFPSSLADQCCAKGYLGILQFLEGCGLDLNAFKEDAGDDLLCYRSLLHTAADHWQVHVADYLIREWNYPVNSSFGSLLDSSPLQDALDARPIMKPTRKIEMVILLLKAGADPNYRDRGGYTAMDLVCGGPGKGARKLVELLLESGFECGQRDRWGQDYLDHIARVGAEESPEPDYDGDVSSENSL